MNKKGSKNLFKIKKINEFHPGAKSIAETIDFYIKKGEEMGITRDMSIEAIQKIINYFDNGFAEKIQRGTKEALAIQNMDQCIRTAEDDGYPIDWILKELRNFI